jgi:hypothetical protein
MYQELNMKLASIALPCSWDAIGVTTFEPFA